ncbi:hypothetical protein EVAR_65_1 [Eumeta japonica]|uniref:Uncharacterized protein n=1 Tax=Eumeta variegata TaxID=151549 RepID=A0A4C1S7W8_EUMVA|nr:hypothetical protein EVAR_65_1 [Eumeta japonica]
MPHHILQLPVGVPISYVTEHLLKTLVGSPNNGSERRNGKKINQKIVLADCRVTVRFTVEKTKISTYSMHNLLREYFEKIKSIHTLVPRLFTDTQEHIRVNFLELLWNRYNYPKYVSGRLQPWIKRLHHNDPETKLQSITWKRPSSPTLKKFKASRSAGKVTGSLFWDD